MSIPIKPIIPSALTIDEDEKSEETIAWSKAIATTRVVKEMSAISGLDLHPLTSALLVTSSRITMYDCFLQQSKNFYNNSPMQKYGGVFRKTDGRLVAVGNQNGKVSIYDSDSAKPLRELFDTKHHHRGPCRRPIFCGQHQIISCSDDKTIKLWDLADGKFVSNFGEGDVHNDHIRASCMVDFNDYFASGSYDSTVKLWDPKNPKLPISTITCPSPVECVVSRKNFLIAASGRSIVVYDLMAGKTFQTLKNIHTQVITGLGLRGNNLLSSSLDGFLKVYSSSFAEVIKYKHESSQLTRLAVDDKTIVVGSADANVTVRRLQTSVLKGDLVLKDTKEDKMRDDFDVDVFVEAQSKNLRNGKKQRLTSYDHALTKFENSRALDCALATKDPCQTVSVIQELIRRDALEVAVAGRSGNSLEIVFSFVLENITDARFQRILLDLATTLIDVYGHERDEKEDVRIFLEKLNVIINQEFDQMILMKEVAGQLEAIASCLE